MKKLKIISFLLSLLLISVSFSPLFGQNVFWIESAFDAPRLVKTGADSSELFSYPLTAGSQPQGLALDEDMMLYWNDLSFINAQIYKAPDDFSSVSVLADSQSVLRGVAVDQLNKKIYWTSTNLIDGPKIGRMGTDGQNLEILIEFKPDSIDTPRSISLDAAAGKMYWTNFGAGTIQRADMSAGAVPEDIVSGLNGPSGIAVDTDSGKVFWTEMNGGQIKSADLDGADITLLADGLAAPNYISVNRSMNRMAWTEMGTGSVKSAALDGTDILDYAVNAMAPAGIVIEPAPDTSFAGPAELRIVPADTMLQVQNFMQFDAQLVDSSGAVRDTDADWYVKRRHVGPISDDGLLFAFFPGDAKIMAKRDSMTAKACLSVVDTTADSSGINKVHIVLNFFKNWEIKIKTIKEGEMFELGGRLHPFNIMNRAAVYFPIGSLHEDITLKFKLPKFARFKKDSIEFANRIINGIEFDVFVNDSLIEPYYFDKPVSAALPFRRGLLKKFGIDITNLGLFFAHDSLTFDSLGISQVMVDSTHNRIYGLVEHFSSLVVRENTNAVSIKAGGTAGVVPSRFLLRQNYPNPFNPITTIEYQLPVSGRVELAVYNTLGQKAAVLVSRKQAAGNYKVEWNASGFASGIYIYKIKTDKGFTKAKKLILLK